jgi:hypothetical protein
MLWDFVLFNEINDPLTPFSIDDQYLFSGYLDLSSSTFL